MCGTEGDEVRHIHSRKMQMVFPEAAGMGPCASSGRDMRSSVIGRLDLSLCNVQYGLWRLASKHCDALARSGGGVHGF